MMLEHIAANSPLLHGIPILMTRPAMVLVTCSVLFLLPHRESVAGKYNKTLSIGDVAPAWEKLPGVDGKLHSLTDLKAMQSIVIAFTCNSCPYAVDYEDRMISLARKYAASDQKVALIAINVNTIDEDRLPKMQERAKEKQFPFAYIHDESQAIGKQYGAIYTPEFYVLNAKREIVYMGALDDHTDPAKATVNYVDLAVQAALAGRLPEVTETGARGCAIRYKRSRRRRKPSADS